METILGYQKVDIIVPKEKFDFLEKYLDECEMVEDAGEDEMLASFSAPLNSSHDVVMNIYNSRTEYGGPWIDPIVFRKGFMVWEEEIVGDILDSFNSSISFIVDGVEYFVGFKREE